MTTIRVTSRNAAGVAVPGARVVVRLVAGPRPTDPGYFQTGDYSITSESHTVTGSTGVKVLTLPPTDGISPDGCFYEIATVTGTNVAKRTIIVPDSGTYDWGDPAIQVLTPVPPEWASVAGPWTAGANDLIQARLEGDTVRIVIPDGFSPIQVEAWPGVGGSEPPYEVLPVGLRPTTPVGWIDTQQFYDQTDEVWVLVAIVVTDNGNVYLLTHDDAAVNPLGIGIPHQMTFPLTSPA